MQVTDSRPRRGGGLRVGSRPRRRRWGHAGSLLQAADRPARQGCAATRRAPEGTLLRPSLRAVTGPLWRWQRLWSCPVAQRARLPSLLSGGYPWAAGVSLVGAGNGARGNGTRTRRPKREGLKPSRTHPPQRVQNRGRRGGRAVRRPLAVHCGPRTDLYTSRRGRRETREAAARRRWRSGLARRGAAGRPAAIRGLRERGAFTAPPGLHRSPGPRRGTRRHPARRRPAAYRPPRTWRRRRRRRAEPGPARRDRSVGPGEGGSFVSGRAGASAGGLAVEGFQPGERRGPARGRRLRLLAQHLCSAGRCWREERRGPHRRVSPFLLGA